MTDSLEDIISKIKRFRDERDWMQFHNHKDMAISLAIEAAELLEHFQWKSTEEINQYVTSHKNEIREELADIAIYLLEIADNLDIGLIQAINDKLNVNAAKYPVKKVKGKATKYTQLGVQNDK